ncbi:MAG: hypothetical protein ACFFDR_04550 [Candidatus Thorarchaeota archaeon]
MKFWYTPRVAYFLLLITLALPFNIMIQLLSSESYTVVIMAPLWQYIMSSSDYVNFAFNPFGIIFVIWFGPSVYISKVAYDATTKKDLTRWDYGKRVFSAMVIQVVIGLVLPPASGYPPPVNLPIFITGIVALLLTRWIVPMRNEVWDVDSAENDVFIE